MHKERIANELFFIIKKQTKKIRNGVYYLALWPRVMLNEGKS